MKESCDRQGQQKSLVRCNTRGHEYIESVIVREEEERGGGSGDIVSLLSWRISASDLTKKKKKMMMKEIKKKKVSKVVTFFVCVCANCIRGKCVRVVRFIGFVTITVEKNGEEENVSESYFRQQEVKLVASLCGDVICWVFLWPLFFLFVRCRVASAVPPLVKWLHQQ